MSIYWISHPNMELSATVHAPTTEKARTVFLDWLERTSQIARGDRQRWRRHTLAERLEYPEELESDVTLHYGYEEARPESIPRVPREELIPEEAPIEEPVPTIEEQRPRLSPIAQAALGSRLGGL